MKKVKNNIEFFEQLRGSSDNLEINSDVSCDTSSNNSKDVKIIEIKSNSVGNAYVDNIKI